jgi:signal transduction histidine kinase
MHCVESNRVLFKPSVKHSVDVSLPGVNFVFGDSLRMTQIINNFLSNAAKFTDKGEIEFSVSVASKDFKTKDIELNFQVSDTGIGMSEDTVKKIFQPFVQVFPFIFLRSQAFC